MPELGEVEIVRLNLEKWWVGRACEDVLLVDNQLLTMGTEDDLQRIFASVCTAARRRGKYLMVDFDGGETVIFHFRMTGKIAPIEDTAERFVRLAWKVDGQWLGFKDSRRLGHVDIFEPGAIAEYAPLNKMGPEPHDMDGTTLKDAVGHRKLKNALMDQSVIAGVGNIAVSEVFFRNGIAPDAHADDLSDKDWDDLAAALITFFDQVIEEQAADEVQYLNQGKVKNPFDVYQREGEACVVCSTPIERTKVAGRSSYFCPTCQTLGA